MSSQTKTVAGTVSNNSANGTVAWSDVANAKTSNDSYATVVLSNQSSQWIFATDFGFTIPTGSVIDDYVASIEIKSDSGSYTRTDWAYTLIKGGVNQNDNDIGDNDTLDTTEKFINLTDSTAFHLIGYTIDDINDSGFGMGWRIANIITDTISIDSFKIVINYTESGFVRDAVKDDNNINTVTAISNANGSDVVRLSANPTTHLLQVDDNTTGTDSGGSSAKHDNNMVTTLIAVSESDGETPVALYADPENGQLLVDTT